MITGKFLTVHLRVFLHFQLELPPPTVEFKTNKTFLIINKVTETKSSVYLGNCIVTPDPRFMEQVDDRDVVLCQLIVFYRDGTFLSISEAPKKMHWFSYKQISSQLHLISALWKLKSAWLQHLISSSVTGSTDTLLNICVRCTMSTVIPALQYSPEVKCLAEALTHKITQQIQVVNWFCS